MKIQLLGWEYHNIRKFDNLEISLENREKVIPVTAIMMRNGTGKTTTLLLLRAIFSGSAITWDKELVCSYRPKNQDAKEGSFSAKVRYILDDGTIKIYRYILHLNYEIGIAHYETSYPEKNGGLEENHKVPPILQGVLNQEEFVNRFIFDGEQAHKTLSTGNEEAEAAIIYLYQLNKLDELNDKIQEVLVIRQENSQNKTALSVKNHRTRMENANKNLINLLEKVKKLKKEINSKKNESSILYHKYQDIITSDDELKREQEELIKRKESYEEGIKQNLQLIMREIKKPYNLHPVLDNKLKTLANDMVSLKLPKSTSQEFFQEMASTAKVCICGREIGPKEKAAIKENAKRYLGEEQLGILNAIKHSIREYEVTKEVDSWVSSLYELSDELGNINTSLTRLALQAEKKGHEEIKEIINKLDRLTNEIKDLEMECERLETNDYVRHEGLTENNNVEKARNKYNLEKANYEKVTDTYRFSQKCERMKAYVRDIRKISMDRLKDYIIKATNEKISTVITNDQIEIKAIDKHIMLKDRDQVSAGQELSVAYAYIGTLFEHAHHEFPFIVDSPAGAMDLETGREAAEILPKLFEQLVIFVTSREVKGFAERFFERDDVQYLTILEKDGKMQIKNDKDFFAKYQTED